MFNTQNDIRASLIEAGIDEASADLLAQQAKPAVWLETRKVEDEAEIPIGATKFGGRPDLPAGVAWPVRPPWPNAEKWTKRLRETIAEIDKAKIPDKRRPWLTPERREEIRRENLEEIRKIESEQPLSFVAQIDLAQIWAAGLLDEDMPKQGVLSIFYDLAARPWGFDPQDRIGFAILFHDAGGILTRREEPDELQGDENSHFPPVACTRHACMTPLPLGTAQYERLDLPDELSQQVYDWGESEDSPLHASPYGRDWTCHRVGGWPTPIQEDMQIECALVNAGHYCGSGDAHKDPSLAAVRATAADWLLLAQIGTDGKGNMVWGDDGQLYLWIRRDDLRARRFANAWLILQCY